MDLIIKNGTIVSPTATFKADVCADNGKIVAINRQMPAQMPTRW